MLTHSFWWLICDALAVYRLAILISKDKITEPIRGRSRTAAYNEDGTARSGISAACERWAYEMIICPWCVGLWLAAAVVVLTMLIPGAWQYAALGLALSGVAGFLADRS